MKRLLRHLACSSLLLLALHIQAEPTMHLTLSGGKAVALQNGGPWLELLSVDEHRCPQDRECYHAGHALLVLGLREQTSAPPTLIGLSWPTQDGPIIQGLAAWGQRYQHPAWQIELQELLPKRPSTDPLPLSAYTVRLRVTRRVP
ncbi:hypothetical protein [Leeia aquatica]|uniref:Uncharacterized protein n=1 Tax=Leeia aquatica TaxID=2725557 RepID=A0A847RSW5_9NEIS|nr:hypothetical protein [Leeia aquatica]NLR74300.1 hypothetical protein [Leeia aquatica]